MLSFLNLKYFLLLSEELNFRSAAKKLHITQQSLSGHVKKLEKHLGVPLFIYGPPLSITPSGMLLKEHAREILKHKQEMEDDILNIKTQKSGTLIVGCTYGRSQFLLPPILSEFQNKYPLTRLQLIEGNTPDIESALKKGEVDVTVGFTPEDIKNIITYPLYHDPFRMVVHPAVLEKCFPECKPIVFRCYEENLITAIIKRCPFLTMTPNTTIGKVGQKYIRQLGLTANTLWEFKDVGTMLSMCYSKMGFMLCPETFIRQSSYSFSQQHLIYPLPGHEPMQISVNYPQTKKNSSFVQAFVKIASNLLRTE